MSRKERKTFFNIEEEKTIAWKGMPSFNQQDLTPLYSIVIHFDCQEDIETFSNLIKQNIYKTTKSL